MSIKCISLVQVNCDNCNEYILIKRWQDAAKLGWTAPIDGAFQRCPTCAKKYLDNLVHIAKINKIADKCPLVNPENETERDL